MLCEKPIATAVCDAAAVADAAAEHPRLRVSCVFQHRDDPALQRARWLLSEGIVGQVSSARVSAHAARNNRYYAEARGRWQTDGGGALMVQGIHLLDAMVWLLGGVDSVSAPTSSWWK